MSTTRQQLAAAQADLLRALMADAPVPAGFDERQVAVEARALRNKRRMVVNYLRPELRDQLGGDRFAELFTAYAAAFPRPTGLRAREDASYFANWLVARKALPRPPRWRKLLLRLGAVRASSARSHP